MSVFLYLAAPQCGKSTLLRRHIYEHRHEGIRSFLIVDRDNRDTWPGLTFTSARAFRAHPVLPRFCVFRGVSGAEVAELAIDLGDCAYVDEEIQRAVIERPWRPWTRENRGAGHPLYTILHEGAHLDDAFGVSRCVSALIATRRPANLPTDLPACCDGVYLGRLPSFADADRCYREGWIPGATSPRAAREILGGREVGEFSFVRVA